ncbi:MAG TPA: hypothetical protein VK824_02850 [Planctomycetota bacterium]|nr:hypothetical protein [Planctomycetota bacterium]
MSSTAPRAAFLLSLLCACAPAVTPSAAAQAVPGEPSAQPAAAAAQVSGARDGTAAPARKRLFDEALVQSTYAEAVAALRDGAQIELREPVPAILLTAAEARERRAAFSRTLPKDAGVTAALDIAADFVFSDTMLGRYLPDEKVLYLIEEVLESNAGGDREVAREQLFGVMAHELVHAHDDQVYGGMPSPGAILEIAADGRRLAEIQMQMTLLEGHAVYAAELASAHAGREPLPAITLEEARGAAVMRGGDQPLSQLGSGLVNTIARTKLVQYAYGREFCKAAWRFGGEKFLGEVFAHLPLSMPEIESFERFKQRWAREKEAEEESAGDVQPAGSAEPESAPR